MERKIILEQLQLLEKIRREHEWVVIEQKEAEEEEKAEVKLESEATELATDKSEEN
ncbi:MAG: hypothetical protein GH144_01070 [Clostridia bacterium]|jgi:hypothetical protein|nr:hypothetical protein [Clostridia bacterium]